MPLLLGLLGFVLVGHLPTGRFGYAESFFSRLRDELLNMEEFMNMADARWFARRWLQEYNHERPHSSLGYQTPEEFAASLPAYAPAADGLALQREGWLGESESTIFTQPVLS